MPAVSQTRSGAYEGLIRLAQSPVGFDEMVGLRSGATGGAVGTQPVHPFNVTANMAGMSPQHLFNTSGNPGVTVIHAFTVTPPPRDWSKRVHQRSSRVVYTKVT